MDPGVILVQIPLFELTEAGTDKAEEEGEYAAEHKAPCGGRLPTGKYPLTTGGPVKRHIDHHYVLNLYKFP